MTDDDRSKVKVQTKGKGWTKKGKRFDWLVWMINEYKFKVGAEVGVATGNTTFQIMSKCPLVEQYFVADDWRPVGYPSNSWNAQNMKEVFLAKLKNFLPKIEILEGVSWEQANYLPNGSLDWVFIDADHEYESVIKDLKAWYPKVKDGGIFCGHDWHFPGVKQALKEFDHEYELTGIDNVWFWQK